MLSAALQQFPDLWYPQLFNHRKGTTIGDIFNRETLTPTGAYTLYTTAVVGTGTFSTNITSQRLNLATSGATNDANSIRTSGFWFRNSFIDNIENTIFAYPTRIVIDIPFTFSSTTNVQIFVGILASSSALSALPTTTRHLGLYVDTSIDNNIRLSSANGTTQSTTDTGIAIGANPYDLRLTITSADTATIDLINAAAQDVAATKSVTSIQNGADQSFELHVFEETLENAVKNFDWRGWKCVFA